MSIQTEIQWGKVELSNEQPPELIDSEIGLINSSWQIQPFEWFLQDNGLSYGVVQPGEDKPDGIRLIRAQNIKGGKVLFDDTKKIAPEIERQYARTRLRGDELLITVVGSLGDTAITDASLTGCNVARAVAVARFKNIEDRAWLKYCFQYGPIQAEIGNVANTTVQPTLNLKELRQIPFPVPAPDEQRAIVAVLSSLDDKIDLLYRQNATLETLAETLFRQWFVEETKEEWEEVTITKLFEIRDGTHDSPKQKAFGKRLVTSKHISGNKLDFESAYFISEEDFTNVNKRSRVDSGDILFSMIGTIGLTYLEQSETVDYAIKNIGLLKTSQNPAWCYYTYLWIKSSLGQDFIHEHRSGSTQEYISLGSLRGIIFKKPPTSLLTRFNDAMKPLFDKRKTNSAAIQTLSTLRDTLLPKLMSGEVRVNTTDGKA